ncbi:ABC transporter permease subunit [bacterium]|nr:ABC transporter permease subunit [bacterium]
MKALRAFPWLWSAALAGLLIFAALGPGGLAGGPEASQLPFSTLLRLSLNSVYTAGIAGLLALVLGGIPALVAARLESRRRGGTMLAVVLVPSLIPPVCFAVAASRITGPNGLLGPLELPLYSLTGAAVILGWALAPFAAAILYPAWRRTSREVEEAALVEVGALRVLLRVVVPQARGAAALAFVVVFLLAASDLSVAETLRGVPVLVREIYVQFGTYYNAAGALSAGLMILPPCTLLGALAYWLARSVPSQETESEDRPSIPALGRRLGWVRWMGWACAITPPALLIGTLLITLSGPGESFLAGARLAWKLALPELVYTTILSTVTAVLTAMLALAAALGLGAMRRPGFARYCMVLCFLTPAPLLGVAIKRLLLPSSAGLPPWFLNGLAAIDGSPAPMVVAWLLRLVPIAALVLEWALRRVPTSLPEAARLEGAGLIGHARAWGYGALRTPVLAVALLAFALSFNETGSALLLVPPGLTTLGVRLMTLLHYAPGAQVSALCLLLCAPAFATAILLAVLPRRNESLSEV